MFNTRKTTFIKVVLFLLLLVGVTSSMPAKATVEASPYITKIAPAHSNDGQAHAEASISHDDLNTYFQELQEAGVHTNGDLKTLSYTELARLLSLWHLAHNMNYYDVQQQPKQVTKHESNEDEQLKDLES